MNSRSEVHHANHYTIEASYKKGQIFHVEYYNELIFCEVKIEMPVPYNEWILVTAGLIMPTVCLVFSNLTKFCCIYELKFLVT